MKTYTLPCAPIEICGLEVIDGEKGFFRRLPENETILVTESLNERAKSACGGRIRFRTDAKILKLSYTLAGNRVDICIPICGSSGADVMEGIGLESKYLGLINPMQYENMHPEREFILDGKMRQITVNLPRNEIITGFAVETDDEAQVLAPVPYSRSGKLCFYGSSITEGGCCTRPGNAYTAAVSRWLDIDYVNYGFSGIAKGEDAFADIICKREFAALVYDYDHNAPTAGHLRATHERFFKRIRAAHPELPVLIMSKPDFDGDPAAAERRAVIFETYRNAVNAGDKKVWFLDGEQFFGVFGREMCSVDGCHPNDLGFYRMTEAVYPVLLKMLQC